MPRIRFTHTGHSHLVGNFSAGDLFTGSAEACRHFVDEAGCAVYADAEQAAESTGTVQAPAPARKAPAKKAAANKAGKAT